MKLPVNVAYIGLRYSLGVIIYWVSILIGRNHSLGVNTHWVLTFTDSKAMCSPNKILFKNKFFLLLNVIRAFILYIYIFILYIYIYLHYIYIYLHYIYIYEEKHAAGKNILNGNVYIRMPGEGNSHWKYNIHMSNKSQF